MKKFSIYFLLLFIFSCSLSNKKKSFYTNFLSEKVLSVDFHSAFPDAIIFNGSKLVSYRAGLTHASDKGVIKIINLKTKNSIEISDSFYDLRNGYFLLNNGKLLFYCSVYDYVSENFVKLNIYEIFIEADQLQYKFIKADRFHQLYDPPSINLGSWSIKNDENWFVFPEKQDSLVLYDEEVSFIEINNKLLGIGRNEKRVGLPLLIFEKNKNNWLVKDWCYEKKNVAIVSPKLYMYNNEIILAYTERKIEYFLNFYRFKIKNYEEAITKIRFYRTYDDLKKCNHYKTKTVYSGNDIDAGYPALIFDKKNIYLYSYEKKNFKTSIIERVFEY